MISNYQNSNNFRIVQNKAHFILLLGYFKAKLVTLTFTYRRTPIEQIDIILPYSTFLVINLHHLFLQLFYVK